MNVFTRLGNAMLHRLAPETSATADWSACTSGCGDWLKQVRCEGPKMWARCVNRSWTEFSEWNYCGYQCV